MFEVYQASKHLLTNAAFDVASEDIITQNIRMLEHASIDLAPHELAVPITFIKEATGIVFSQSELKSIINSFPLVKIVIRDNGSASKAAKEHLLDMVAVYFLRMRWFNCETTASIELFNSFHQQLREQAAKMGYRV